MAATQHSPKSLVPSQYFKTLCQSPTCRQPLGGFHAPLVGSTVLYACHRCHLVSIFRVEAHEIVTQLQDRNGRIVDTNAKPREASRRT